MRILILCGDAEYPHVSLAGCIGAYPGKCFCLASGERTEEADKCALRGNDRTDQYDGVRLEKTPKWISRGHVVSLFLFFLFSYENFIFYEYYKSSFVVK